MPSSGATSSRTHVALWRSFAAYDGRCSERTWVYRVAHNAAADHVRARRRLRAERLVDLEEAAGMASGDDPEAEAGERRLLARLTALLHRRSELERQRRALASVGAWYLLPLLPGTMMFTLAPTLDRWPPTEGLGFHEWFPIGLILAVFLFIWALNLRAARRLAAEIEELDALVGER